MAMPNLSPRKKRFAIGVVSAAIAGISTIVGWRLSHANATPPQAAGSVPTADAPVAAPSGAAPSGEMPATSQITFSTVPSARATVYWGKTLLGRIAPHEALVVTRPRDSGPLDVIVRAAGYLPVHTRAHTFADTTVAVKLTRPDQKETLFGYRAPLDAGTPEDEALSAPPTGTEMPQPPQ